VIQKTNLSFVTYFSKEFLIQGSVAVDSFIKIHPLSQGFIVCLDPISFHYMKSKKYPFRIKIYEISELSEINTMFNFFLETRTFAESIISIKPRVIERFIDAIDAESYLVYFDADLFFFDSMLEIESISNGVEVILCEHLFPKSMMESLKFGRFNGGLIVFRNSQISKLILNRWQVDCTEWCKLELRENKFADQKYLDQYATLPGVVALTHPGVNNGQYYFKEKRKFEFSIKNRKLKIEGVPLLSFHFHGIRIFSHSISTGFNRYDVPRQFPMLFFGIYLRYVRAIRREISLMRRHCPEIWIQIARHEQASHLLRKLWQLVRFTRVPHLLFSIKTDKKDV